MKRNKLKKKLCSFLLLQLDDVENQSISLKDILWEFTSDQEDIVLQLLKKLEEEDDVLVRDKNTGMEKISNVAGLQDLAEKK